MAVKEGKSRVMISLSDELRSIIEQQANESKRSMSAEIEVSLDVHYKKIAKQRDEMLEKMNDMQSFIQNLNATLTLLSKTIPKYNEDNILTLDTVTPDNKILHYMLTSVEDINGNRVSAEEYIKSKNIVPNNEDSENQYKSKQIADEILSIWGRVYNYQKINTHTIESFEESNFRGNYEERLSQFRDILKHERMLKQDFITYNKDNIIFNYLQESFSKHKIISKLVSDTFNVINEAFYKD